MTSTILVIDDDAAQRDLLRHIFEEEGFRVITVDDAADAFNGAAGSSIDLILLDLVMPRARMDGFAFLSELRSRSDLKDTPVAILSGLGDSVTEAIDPGIARSLRIACVITKPFVIPDIIREVRRVLGGHGNDPSPGRAG